MYFCTISRNLFQQIFSNFFVDKKYIFMFINKRKQSFFMPECLPASRKILDFGYGILTSAIRNQRSAILIPDFMQFHNIRLPPERKR
jgi:hypothetical protein